ncbi:MAG: hypothetical protein DRQ55_08085, partial [Planctomycetota bacterium]
MKRLASLIARMAPAALVARAAAARVARGHGSLLLLAAALALTSPAARADEVQGVILARQARAALDQGDS